MYIMLEVFRTVKFNAYGRLLVNARVELYAHPCTLDKIVVVILLIN